MKLEISKGYLGALVAAFAGIGTMCGCDAPKVKGIHIPTMIPPGTGSGPPITEVPGFPTGCEPPDILSMIDPGQIRSMSGTAIGLVHTNIQFCPLPPAPRQIAFWALCNYSAQGIVPPPPPLPTTDLEIDVEDLTGGVVTVVSSQHFPLTVPPLEPRACFIQEFGITSAGVPSVAADQPTLVAGGGDFSGSGSIFSQVFQSTTLAHLPGAPQYVLKLTALGGESAALTPSRESSTTMRTNNLSRAVLVASGTALLFGASTAGASGPEENDLLDSFQPNTLVTCSLTSSGVASSPGIIAVAYGGASLSTTTPFCVPEATAPCVYTLNHLLVVFQDFDVGTNLGTYSFSNAYALIQGPLSVSDSGLGIVIPVGTVAEAGATINGPSVSNLFQANTEQVTGSLVLSVTPATGFLSLDGELPFDFSVSALGQSFSGSISGFVDGSAPLLNTAPIANAGPPLSVVCPQTVALHSTGTTDLENNITDFLWTFSGLPFLSVDGPTASVFLGEGTTVATLTVTDLFNGIGRAQVPVTVTIPPPSFGGAPSSQVEQSCSSGPSAVPVTLPQALVCGAAVPVTGTVTSFNGAAVSIPVVGGTVNVPPGTGTLQFVATNEDGVSTTFTQTLTVLAPTTFFGSQGVAVDDGSSVQGTIYAGAGGQTLLQNDVIAGNVVSLSPVVLQDRVTVTAIDTNAGVTPGHTDHIGSSSSATPVLPAFPAAATTFTGTRAVSVNPSTESGDVVTLPPGQYGAVTVFSRGQLVLSAGRYEFTSLDLEPQAQILTPSPSAETAQIFVRDTVIYRGSTLSAATPAPLYLAYAGAAPLTIESPFLGTIVAPNASLSLQSLNGSGVYKGEFFAKQISLSPHTSVASDPFTCVP